MSGKAVAAAAGKAVAAAGKAGSAAAAGAAKAAPGKPAAGAAGASAGGGSGSGGSAAASMAAAAAKAVPFLKEAQALLTLSASTELKVHASTLTLTPVGAVPALAPLGSAAGPKLFRKRMRLHPHWKLRRVRKWSDFVPFIKEIIFSFDPAVEGCTGARELARQCKGDKIRSKFPKCMVTVNTLDDGSPAVVTVKWVSGRESWHESERQGTSCCLPAHSSHTSHSLCPLPPSPPPQINDKFSSTPAHFMTFEEVLDKFEEDRLMLQREEEDKEMA
jgi:hypothetical protein